MIDYKKLKEKLNHLQIETIETIKTYMNDCHEIDLVIRHNGQDVKFEADFLKHLFREMK
jgi:hypothetical protein